MPTKTIRCQMCRRAISGYDLSERMGKLRRHYKSNHPRAFAGWHGVKRKDTKTRKSLNKRRKRIRR